MDCAPYVLAYRTLLVQTLHRYIVKSLTNNSTCVRYSSTQFSWDLVEYIHAGERYAWPHQSPP